VGCHVAHESHTGVCVCLWVWVGVCVGAASNTIFIDILCIYVQCVCWTSWSKMLNATTYVYCTCVLNSIIYVQSVLEDWSKMDIYIYSNIDTQC
jgi:hypothetical protein